MRVFLLPVFYVLIVCLVKNAHTSPYVQVDGCLIVGKKISFSGCDVNQYLGVPYAQPPVGPLRFKRPVPLSRYPFFYAFTNPPACPQYSENPYPWYTDSTEKSEDCLHLNIWTPADASPTNKKAVMYWMHGGGFRYGSIRDEVFSGVALASLGDIIVVTVNYRLGVFGLMASGSDDAPGNAGLWDVLEGLRWVNKHIEAFGGDSTRITISGESAGSYGVGMIPISPLARGLYSRIIMESGSPVTRLTDNNRQNILLGQKIAKSLRCANDTYTIEEHPKEVVKCLRDVDAFTLSLADFPLTPHFTADFYPQYGDELFPDNQRTSIIDGNFACADLLVGHNKDEGAWMVTTVHPEVYGFFGEKNPHINKTFGGITILADPVSYPGASLYPNPQSIVDHYLPANLTDDYSIRQQAYTALGDMLLHCPTVYYAEKCAEQRRNVYYYVFTHRPSVTPWAPWMGTTHFEEVQFVFGQPVLNPEKYLQSEVVLSRQMIDIWTNFVKHGKPNLPWPLYFREDPAFKYLGPEYEESGSLSNCDFLRPFYGF